MAGIAVFNMNLANRYSYMQMRDGELEAMNYQNIEDIYAYLECAVEREELSELEYWEKYGKPGTVYVDVVDTKITLKNGRSYYRRYRVSKKDREVMWKLFAGEEYLRYGCCVSKETMESCTGIAFARNERYARLENASFHAISSIAKAFNEDVLEKPECVLRGEGRLLVRLVLLKEGEEVQALDIYEEMERTVAAVKEAGFEEWVKAVEPSEISEITLPLGSYVNDFTTAENVVAAAGRRYGVDVSQDKAGTEETENTENMQIALENAPMEEELFPESTQMEYYGSEWEPQLRITDPAEIEELLEFVSYAAPFRGRNLFREEYVSITAVNTDGESSICYIPKGVLPEKYILEFGELSRQAVR